VHRLLNERAIWTGQWKDDWTFFHANEHPLYSVFYCHNAHPFTHRERAVVLWACLCFSFLLASVTQIIKAENGSNNVIGMLISLGFGVCGSVYHKILQWLGTCGCFEERNVFVRKLAEYCGRCLLVLSAMSSTVCMVFGILLLSKHDSGIGFFVIDFFVSQILSFVSCVAIDTALYEWKRRHELKDNAMVAELEEYRKAKAAHKSHAMRLPSADPLPATAPTNSNGTVTAADRPGPISTDSYQQLM